MKKADIVFPEGGFDCVICIGNSFPHLLDFDGDNGAHFQAIKNFRDCLKPGGILVIDHRNFDHIIAGGKAPVKNIYYDVSAYVILPLRQSIFSSCNEIILRKLLLTISISRSFA